MSLKDGIGAHVPLVMSETFKIDNVRYYSKSFRLGFCSKQAEKIEFLNLEKKVNMCDIL